MTLPPPQSSPFLNLSGAPASTHVGLCAVDADVSIWNVLPSVQNAGEFRKMWRDDITDKVDDDFDCDFIDFLVWRYSETEQTFRTVYFDLLLIRGLTLAKQELSWQNNVCCTWKQSMWSECWRRTCASVIWRYGLPSRPVCVTLITSEPFQKNR